MSLLFLQNSLFSIHPSLRTPRVTRLAGYLRSEIDRLIRVLPSDSRFRAGANLIKVALKFVPVFLPVDSEFLQERTPVRGMPVELHNAERMSTHGERRDLCIGQHRHTHFTVMCLCGKLTLIQRG